MIFVDSSDRNEIRDLFAWGVASGATTNPLILARESPGQELEATIRGVLAESTGPVSVELVAETEAEMLAEARTYASWDARICIKVPFSEAGLRVTSALARAHVPTNVTAVMSFSQGYLAALAGATFVSIFQGRIRDMGYDAAEVIADLRAQLDREGLEAKIIVGSIRHMMDVADALRAGAHVVTVPPAILRKMLHNPKTDETIREFNAAWSKRAK